MLLCNITSKTGGGGWKVLFICLSMFHIVLASFIILYYGIYRFTAAKFGSIIQGTPKGLGIADRYPRAPSSSHSASLTLGKREEQRDGKDDVSRGSFLNNSFNRLMTHKV